MTEAVVGDRVVATAPVRAADVGGWTDTWFGSPGRVCHVAVGPGVAVEAELVPRAVAGPVRVIAPDIGADRFFPLTGDDGGGAGALLGHAAAAVLDEGALPDALGVELRICSAVPPGASLGTSAAVVVAVLAALDVLVAGGHRSAPDLAVLAHQVETGRAGRESGVQDQWAAAMGGVGLLAIGPYPDARHEPIALRERARADLDDRLLTVVFGAHDSSLVHAEVINAMVGCSGPDHDRARQAQRRLAALAGDAAAALADGAVDQWGEVLVASTEAQRALHPGLIGPAHQAAIDAARACGAMGWKVNGAGGDGGSLTVVTAPDGREATAAALASLDPTWTLPDLHPTPDGVSATRVTT